MKIKHCFRLAAGYQAFVCFFGIFHETFLNYNFYRLLESDYPGWLKLSACGAVVGISGFLALGLFDGIVDFFLGSCHFFPLWLLEKFPGGGFQVLLSKMMALREKKLSDFLSDIN